MSSVQPLPNAVSELFAQASNTGELTLADRYGILAVLLSESMSEEERRSIDRLLYAIGRGRVRVVNDLSALL
ncbi:MAG: hypothetical protein SFW36_05660 [Leptolyngbyaceae cyanobacterium bins.59]|nr:hypothetical protein [Leptolyngbyaceae cyanobacterium bins.59]